MPHIEFHPSNSAFQGLLDTLNKTFSSNTSSYSLLLGPPGMGKSTALYNAFMNCSLNSDQNYLQTICPRAKLDVEQNLEKIREAKPNLSQEDFDI